VFSRFFRSEDFRIVAEREKTWNCNMAVVPYRQIVIPYRSRDFGAGPVVNGSRELNIWPDDLLWAAVTVGRGNFADLLAHGLYSEYEIIYRINLVLANLARTSRHRITRSSAMVHLDPSEKGAVSYFLGMTMSKLFANELLDVPWVLHFDVYRDRLNPAFAGGTRSQPDLIGRSLRGEWVVMESKGRTNGFSPNLLAAGKQQTRSIRSIAGRSPRWRIACVTHFSGNDLRFDWADPDEFDEDAFDIETDVEEFLALYYRLIYNILANNDTIESDGFILYRFVHLGLTVGLRTSIYDAYQNKRLKAVEAGRTVRFRELPEISGQQFYIGADGVAVGISNEVRELLRYK
jgi:hypothetical protein